jgi:glycosyltransferase involved in cell wall biosynthesis
MGADTSLIHTSPPTAMQTKILYIVTKGTWGGAQRYVYDLATSLPEDSIPVVVAGSEGRLTEKLRARHIRVIPVSLLRRDVFFLRELGALFSIVRIIRAEKPDVVHLNSSKAGALGALAARLAGVRRIIFTAHGWPFTEERSRIERLIITAISWATMVLSHTTIVLSERDLALARPWPGSHRLILIPNGVRKDSAFNPTHAKRILETEYGVPAGRIIIGTIAELHPNKGLSDLITTLPMLPDDAHLVLIGDGELRGRLMEFANQLGVRQRISFLGFVPDAWSLIPGFDAFVLSSTKEGLPFVILEAGSQEVPIIATAVGGIPDVITDGADGFLVPPHDCERLAARINETLTDKEAARTRALHLSQRIAMEFSFDANTLPRTLALYRSEVGH